MATTTLRAAMQSFLDDWQADLPAAWRSALGGQNAKPDFAAISASDPELDYTVGEPIFPGRKSRIAPGAPDGSHIFRALEGTTPSKVRAVIIGQDPYPRIEQATGRAFDQGDLTEWKREPTKVADSLERIVACVADFRTSPANYTSDPSAGETWKKVYDAVACGTIQLPPPSKLFDYWQSQGVIFLNTALTLTRFKKGGHPHQLKGHIPLWAPVVGGIVKAIVERQNSSVVFLLWGRPARSFFAKAGKQAAQTAGTWGTRVRSVEHPHPAAGTPGQLPSFFAQPNPFTAANESLAAMGAEQLRW